VTTEAIAAARAPRVRTRAGRTAWMVGAGGFLGGSILLGILVGPVELRPLGVLAELVDRLPFAHVTSGLTDREGTILWELRMPRVLLGGLVGASLSLAGAAYQGVFRNPLADPYLLGAAAGAGLGATLGIAYIPGVGEWPVDPVPLAAFGGALLAVAGTYALGRSAGRARTATTLILAGVAMASFLTAVQAYFQQLAAETLPQVYTWILGRLSTTGWDEVVLILPYVGVSAAAILLHRRLLDVMSVGDDEADSLGIRARRVRVVVVVAATVGTAAAVAVSGLIGFVGIIVPHTVRLVAGSSYRVVVPLSLLFGAAFLILTDLLARTLVAPAELPIGVITAFFGAPFFFLVLRRSRRLE
jgi:iron complex transport system permease protein